WDHENYGFMHLGFQEYLAAREIRTRFQREMIEEGRSEMLKDLAGRFGESWWREVALLLLALEDPPLFTSYMREVVRLPVFARHADLVEMSLDDAVQPSARPFIELLNKPAGGDPDLWKRQLLALRMAERFGGDAFTAIVEKLKGHPHDEIRQWIRERFKQADQEVIRPVPSEYELVLIKGGTFRMGSNEYDDVKPVHEVTASDFYMGRYPVTNEEYGRFMEATGCKEPALWAEREFSQPRQPVVGVSWHDARDFAQWAGLQLPTEAQWEYACRSGSATRYSWGDEPDCSRANYGNSPVFDECKDANPGKTSPVGDYPPNNWGLYDMHGNVWEWCEDHWHEDYTGAPSDGGAWVDREKGAIRVQRGGAWNRGAEDCRAAYRNRIDPDYRVLNLGFRLVRLPGQLGEPDKSSQ
ncbi:MAG: SUMF1/EgtB/PvdO family nonheme iron enzyme, partial [Desulfobacterales bacterium]|nr:SUMF1/EgtB/PvdO family nonheme iron enzyme [Desulfobacterales bacterium]